MMNAQMQTSSEPRLADARLDEQRLRERRDRPYDRVITESGSLNSAVYNSDVAIIRLPMPQPAPGRALVHAALTETWETKVTPLRYRLIISDPALTLTLGSTGQVYTLHETARSEPIIIRIADEAKKRLSSHTAVTDIVLSLIKEESQRAGVLPKITIGPSWSHEYEDLTGVVIDVEIKGDTEKRFSLWETISSKLDALVDSLDAKNRSFLTNNISIVVNQAE